MTRFTTRQLITAASAVWLTLVTVLAILALRQTIYYSLPIPSILGAFTVALPPLAGIALESIVSFKSTLAARGELQNSKVFQAINAAFLVYEAVLASLAGTYIAPRSGLHCPLEARWQAMYSARDAVEIQRIQDAFDCCGFNTPRHEAYPFPDDGRQADACTIRYERTTSCHDPWMASQRRVAAIMMAVPIAVFMWKMVLFLVPNVDASWLPSAIQLPNENTAGGGRSRPAITYRNSEVEGEADSAGEEVRRLNTDSNLATEIEGVRVRPSALIQETETWGRE